MEEEKFCTCRYMHDMEKRVKKGGNKIENSNGRHIHRTPPCVVWDDEQLPPYKPMNQVGGYQKHQLYPLLTL